MASSSSFHPAHVTKAPREPSKDQNQIEGEDNNEESWEGNFKMSENPKMSGHRFPPDTPLREYKSMKNGKPHKSFPRNLGEFNALTERILDELAEHFSQKVRNGWTSLYPMQTTPLFGQANTCEMKRYLFGVFIGLGESVNPWPKNSLQPPKAQHQPHRRPISSRGHPGKYDPSLDPAPKKQRSSWNWLWCGGGHQEG